MSDSRRRLTVAAAVIRDERGRVLLTRRPEGSHMAGLWEFPGGKLHPEESPADGLKRELAEELGVEAAVGEPITFAVHEEPGLVILLLFYEVRIVHGEPRAHAADAIRWVATSDLENYPMPPADRRLVDRLTRDSS